MKFQALEQFYFYLPTPNSLSLLLNVLVTTFGGAWRRIRIFLTYLLISDFLSLSLAQTLSQNGRVHCNLFFRRVKHKISFWHQAQETLTLLYQIVQDWYFHHVNWKLKIFKNFLLRDDLCSWWLCSWRMEMGNELSLPFVVYNIVLVFRVRPCTLVGHLKC